MPTLPGSMMILRFTCKPGMNQSNSDCVPTYLGASRENLLSTVLHATAISNFDSSYLPRCSVLVHTRSVLTPVFQFAAICV